MTNRRVFLKGLTALAGIATLSKPEKIWGYSMSKEKQLSLSFAPYTLDLKHTFTVSGNSRKTSPIVLTQLSYGSLVGYGEASMPPYLGESHDSVLSFLSKVDLSKFKDPLAIAEILAYVDSIAPLNKAAKASIDIALHDLVGKIKQKPWHQIWGLDKTKVPYTSFTIGIDTPDVVRQKVREAEEFHILKVKLGRDNDKQMIETIREVSDKPICVDVNQGWKNKEFALEMAHWLKEKGIIFIEQAMPKEDIESNAWLTQHSPLPTFGDEAVQRLEDVRKAHHVYTGINIKLMKCTGMNEAYEMIKLARELDMKVMLGCMTESSCAIGAMAQLSPLADFVDLDGNLLISNDPFVGHPVKNGKIILNDLPGIGVNPR